MKHLLLFGVACYSLFTAVNPVFAQGLAFMTDSCPAGLGPHYVVAAVSTATANWI